MSVFDHFVKLALKGLKCWFRVFGNAEMGAEFQDPVKTQVALTWFSGCSNSIAVLRVFFDSGLVQKKLLFPPLSHFFLIIGTTASTKSLGTKNFIYIFYVHWITYIRLKMFVLIANGGLLISYENVECLEKFFIFNFFMS